MNREQLLEQKCFDFARLLMDGHKAWEDQESWRLKQLHFSAVKTGVFVRKSLMHDSRREHVHHMLQACVHALESQYWLQLLSDEGGSGTTLQAALAEIADIIEILTAILKLKNHNPNY